MALVPTLNAPIIEGVTPWQRTRVIVPGGDYGWPPDRDEARLARYDEYLALIENRVADVFDSAKLKDDQREKIQLAVAMPELLCNVWADAVWGTDPPTIAMPGSASTSWERIDAANDWTESGARESVFAAAAFGHSIVRLYRDSDRAARLNLDTDVVIEEIDPAIYFPVLRRGTARDLDAVVLAWVEDRSDPDSNRVQLWQVRELHTVEDGTLTVVTQERPRRSGFGNAGWTTVATERAEGVDFLPFVELHAQRWRGRYWGVSELSRNMTLFDQLDSTVSNIAEILDYHGKPMLQVPASTLFGGILHKGADRALGIRNPDEANIARYITYDGQLDAHLQEIDKTLELMFLTAEVPRTYFGFTEQGAPSGTSLKLQLQNYLKKAGRWQRADARRHRELIAMACRLDGITVAQRDIDYTPGSPLPVDDEQVARTESGLFTAKLASRREAITRIRGGGFDVDAEMAAIDADTEAAMERLPQITPPAGNTPPNTPPDNAS